MDKLWELKKVGVAMFLIGHTKPRTQSDPTTGEDFDILTTDLQYNYFNALKTKLHVLGVAYIDRTIAKEKLGKKDIMGKELTVNRVKGEKRKIAFRDDNFGVDSKSRFADIVDRINLNSDEFIKAIEDAILAEHNKGSDKPVEKVKKEQEKEKKAEVAKETAKIKKQKEGAEIQSIIDELSEFAKANTSTPEKIKPLMVKAKELGLTNPLKVEKIEDARALLEVVKS